MVLSKLNNTIEYPEKKGVYPDDLYLDAELYEIQIYDTNRVIALGNMKNTYEDKEVLFFPIYLLLENEKVMQIGLYEVTTNEYMTLWNNQFDLENINDPLFYSFVTKEWLNIPVNTTEVAIIPEERKDIFILSANMPPVEYLQEESATDAQKEKDDFISIANSPNNWVQVYFSNKHYYITDNEGGGDCLFATIRDAFSSIYQQTTITKIRNKLAQESDEIIYQNYKEQYDMYNAALIKDTNDIKELTKEYQMLKSQIQQIAEREKQMEVLHQAKLVKEKHDRLLKEKVVTNQILQEYKFMKGIKTLADFREKIRKCDFWADTWAISTLERILNIKFIILSSENYHNNDLKNVVQCGQLNDSILENKGIFTPEYYIIIEHTGSHYKLIGYKNKSVFVFREIPYDIKKAIVDKCMEKNAGVFALIPDFQEFKNKMIVHPSIEKEREVEEYTESAILGIYNEDIVFVFYSKSNDKPLPGKGSGEQIPNNRLKDFAELATIAKWRKKLSNFWQQPFTLDNHTWSSVEHYYQASKFKKNNPAYYLTFSLDSKTELSQSPEMAKAAGSKSGIWKKETEDNIDNTKKTKEKVLLRPLQVTIDPDFFSGANRTAMRDSIYAKFTQNPDLKQLLLATLDAKLLHYRRGSPPEISDDLMFIRNKIRREINID